MERSIERLREVLGRNSGGADSLDPSPFEERFLSAMDDDLNTPRALAALFDLADRIREGLDQQGVVLEDTPQGTQWQYQPRG